MRLLIFTQAVDLEDNVLSFFHRWLEELAPHFEELSVVCLKEGKHNLPANVRIYSLGKETGQSRSKYITRFYKYAWSLRHEYDSVFIHMNQEYGILGGWLWWLMGKRIYMWRNHHEGTLLTDVAAFFCTAIFCTSLFSYTARYKKTIIMPVGVDTKRFFPDVHISRTPRSILFFSGIWQTKRPEMLIDALEILHKKGIAFTADFYGSPLPDGKDYYQSVKDRVTEKGLHECVSFYLGVPNTEAPDIYRSHDIFVNCSESGMFDKTLFEAAASGCRVLAASKDFATLAGTDSYFDTVETLATRLADMLAYSAGNDVPAFVQEHSLVVLAERLAVAVH